MTDMENSTKEIPREDYTLIAQEDLRLISENEKLKEAIEKGDTSELERLLLEKSYAKYLFGDYLKRMVYELYIFPEDDGRKITEIPEDEYIKDIQGKWDERCGNSAVWRQYKADAIQPEKMDGDALLPGQQRACLPVWIRV